MKFKKIIIFGCLFLLILSSKNFALENKILFKIDNKIITSVDILNEIEYLKLLNKNLINLEKEKIFEISKNSIIREKIKEIELLKRFKELKVDQRYYDLVMKDFIIKMKLKTFDELKDYIQKKDIQIEMIEKKITIEILWNQLVIDKYSTRIKIDKQQIRDDIEKNNLQKEFLISEILFNLEKKEKLVNKFNKIREDIKSKDFENAALIHSVSSSASNGGKLGWIKLNSLNLKIKDQILKTNIGNFTQPIVIPGGFLILKIEDARDTKIITNIDEEMILIIKEKTNKQLNQFSNIYFNKIKQEVLINEF